MYTERQIKEKFSKVAKIYNIIAVVGARQSGKTTFLKEQIKQLKSSYVLFDDIDARNLFEEDIKKFEKQYIEGYEITVLDEVQYCKDAGTKLKYLADSNKKLWITSSSEILLGKNVLAYLVGRVSIIRIFPFSIEEFLSAKNIKEFNKEILLRNAWEHITYGGYPKVVTTEEIEMKKVILKDLYDTMILKDIAKTFSIEDIRALEEFTKYLAINIGNILSYGSVSKDMGLSFQTIKKYLDAMEKSYIILRVPPFHTNKNKEISKQPKVYFIDTGLRNTVSKNFDVEPDGRLFENYVFSEIIKSGFSPKYWRTKTKAEVDFVIEHGKELLPIEAKLKADGKIERSLNSFIGAYKPKTALVVSFRGHNEKIKLNGCEVIFTDIIGMKQILENKI